MSQLETVFGNIANAIRAKNGSSDTYTPSSMAGAIADIPSGGVSILNGTTDPLSAQGEDGQLYFKYGDDPNYVYDETLGGYILKDYRVSEAGDLLCEGEGRTYSKTYDGVAIAACWHGDLYYGPVLVYTSANNVAYSSNESNPYSVVIDGVTWYVSTTNYWVTTLSKTYLPMITKEYYPTSENAQTIVEDMLEASGFRSTVDDTIVQNTFAKVNGTWQNLIGTDIDDISNIPADNGIIVSGEFTSGNARWQKVDVNCGFKPNYILVKMEFGNGYTYASAFMEPDGRNYAWSVWNLRPIEGNDYWITIGSETGETGITDFTETGFKYRVNGNNTFSKHCQYWACKIKN